ncbi:hypothetical protein NEAUS03_1154 [Nematocida ausubeli]|nr:hypothetical protein NEAUS03_1154 [Nematocida ausubeli]
MTIENNSEGKEAYIEEEARGLYDEKGSTKVDILREQAKKGGFVYVDHLGKYYLYEDSAQYIAALEESIYYCKSGPKYFFEYIPSHLPCRLHFNLNFPATIQESYRFEHMVRAFGKCVIEHFSSETQSVKLVSFNGNGEYKAPDTSRYNFSAHIIGIVYNNKKKELFLGTQAYIREEIPKILAKIPEFPELMNVVDKKVYNDKGALLRSAFCAKGPEDEKRVKFRMYCAKDLWGYPLSKDYRDLRACTCCKGIFGNKANMDYEDISLYNVMPESSCKENYSSGEPSIEQPSVLQDLGSNTTESILQEQENSTLNNSCHSEKFNENHREKTLPSHIPEQFQDPEIIKAISSGMNYYFNNGPRIVVSGKNSWLLFNIVCNLVCERMTHIFNERFRRQYTYSVNMISPGISENYGLKNNCTEMYIRSRDDVKHPCLIRGTPHASNNAVVYGNWGKDWVYCCRDTECCEKIQQETGKDTLRLEMSIKNIEEAICLYTATIISDIGNNSSIRTLPHTQQNYNNNCVINYNTCNIQTPTDSSNMIFRKE